ncbi:MAG: STAS domain-containing protein [Frankiaceae bacterium]|nr:STAS domain-containing protein [Frankiaceae bacterium]
MTTTLRPSPAVSTVVGIAITIEPAIESVGDLRIHLTGELDAWSGPTLKHALTGLRPPAGATGHRRSRVVLDLHELSFLDVSGLSALDESRSALLAAGWIVTAGPAQPHVCRLLRYAARCGWLADGPLVAEASAASHLHVTPTPAGQRRRPHSITSVHQC